MQHACFRALSNHTAHKARFRYDTAHEAVLVVSCRGGQFERWSVCSSQLSVFELHIAQVLFCRTSALHDVAPVQTTSDATNFVHAYCLLFSVSKQ